MENEEKEGEETPPVLKETEEKPVLKRGLSRYFIDLPFIKGKHQIAKARIVYGYDAERKEAGFSGYYLEVNDTVTGKNLIREGFNDDLEGGELLILLERTIPDTVKRTAALELLEEHKGSIASGLPI